MSHPLKKLSLCAAALTSLAFTAPAAVALDAGDWLVRGRIINIDPDSSSSNVTSNGTMVPGTTVGVDGAYTLDIDFTYMFTKNIGMELLLDLSSQHDVYADGATLQSLAPGNIIETRVLPPALLLQYHILPDDLFRPYVGVGVNYTLFFDEKATDSLDKGLGGVSDLELESSVGWAAQIGFDYEIDKQWFVNFDVKYIDIATTAKFKSGALGNVEVDVDVNPWVFGIGAGMRF